MNLRKLETNIKLSEEEEKLCMDHFKKRRLSPSSPFSANLKSILINHLLLFGEEGKEVATIKEFIREFIGRKTKEVRDARGRKGKSNRT